MGGRAAAGGGSGAATAAAAADGGGPSLHLLDARSLAALCWASGHSIAPARCPRASDPRTCLISRLHRSGTGGYAGWSAFGQMGGQPGSQETSWLTAQWAMRSFAARTWSQALGSLRPVVSVPLAISVQILRVLAPRAVEVVPADVMVEAVLAQPQAGVTAGWPTRQGIGRR